jgi:hypothetical protein
MTAQVGHREEAKPTRQFRGLAFRVANESMRREIVTGMDCRVGCASSLSFSTSGFRLAARSAGPFAPHLIETWRFVVGF